MIPSTVKHLMGLVSIMPQVTAKTKQIVFRESYSLILGDRNDVLEFCPSKNVTEVFILLLPDVDGSTVT